MLALAVEAGSLSAATTIYTDRAAFDLATGGSLAFEDFSNASVNGFTLATTSSTTEITNGQLLDRPTPASNGGDATTFTFDAPTTAFGGSYDLSVRGNGNGLRFVLDGAEIVSEELSAPYTGFWGFISDTAFNTVRVEAGSGSGRAETHTFDGFSFGIAAPVAPIPVPASLPMLLAALACAFGWRRWQRRAAAPA